MFFQPLEQFDSNILLYFYNEIYLSTITFSIYNVFFFSSFLLTFTYFNKKPTLFFWRYIIMLLLNFFTFELYNQQVNKKAQGYMAIFFTLFIYLFFSNILGLFFFGFTVTSHISVTFFFSLTFFLSIIIIGFFKHGLNFFYILVPSGAPKPLLPFLIFIEFISYMARVFSLAIRLFANMMSGHTLLGIIASFSYFLYKNESILFLFPLFVIFILLFLEFAIAALQAYVFAVLVCIYLNDAILLDH